MSANMTDPCFDELELKIAGDWSADDLSKLASSMSGICDIFASIMVARSFQQREKDVTFPISEIHSRINEYRRPGDSLRISRIQMASPGAVVFLAPAAVIHEMREFVFDLILRIPKIAMMNTIELVLIIRSLIKNHGADSKEIETITKLFGKEAWPLVSLCSNGKISLPERDVP